eukprot:4877364-Lingulodinium_polyedra.AAC.1
MKPDAGQSTVIVYYDEKLASEAMNQPSARKCPARHNVQETCISNKFRIDGNRIAPGVLYIMPDHGKAADRNTFKHISTKPLQPSDGSKAFELAVFDLAFDEESLRRRRRNLRH